jgi:hypothetical protein
MEFAVEAPEEFAVEAPDDFTEDPIDMAAPANVTL